MKFSKVKALATTGATAIYLGLMNAQVVLAADGGEVKSKLTQAGKTIQGILTGLVALAAAIIWIFPWVYSLFT
ncbi:CagC family type IV secretion system protein [Lactobacillus delbrueckii]|uniref:CagC family type IV secretion system protein n=1 Tax=Lactobacillus delbrueckii TaxID=1584 RepID=UPI003A88E7B6